MSTRSESSKPSRLIDWQAAFVNKYVQAPASKSLLVADAGTGKTFAVLAAASRLKAEKAIDLVLVVSDRLLLKQQWADAASQQGLDLPTSIADLRHSDGASLTSQSLQGSRLDELLLQLRSRKCLVVVDDPSNATSSAVAFVGRVMAKNVASRALVIARHGLQRASFRAEFEYATEYIVDKSTIQLTIVQPRILKYAPSLSLLGRLQSGNSAIDGLSWRQFEQLIATLLEQDGYTVDLMQGSKDGGVDVVATRDFGPGGYFKAVWQAKKIGLNNKVGLAVIRELADTRIQFGASKGVIVTSSYLTRGAVERIERDKYLLEMVDRDKLQRWINRTLLGGSR